MNRIVLTTGGTGGHIFPALAVAEEIRAQRPQARLLFIGGRKGPEREMAEAANIEFKGLPVLGVLGRGIRGIWAGLLLVAGFVRALFILARFRPQAVLGFGGYASLPAAAAGRLVGAKLALHEQNSVPGLSNRLAGRLAHKIFLSFPDKKGMFAPKKTVLTGNPVRESIRELAREDRTAKYRDQAREKRILVLGGSQGARALNRAMVKGLPKLQAAGVAVLHQSGKLDYEETFKAYERAGYAKARVEPFITDMRAAYEWADLAVCRAGAGAVFELAAAGVPAIFAPYPYATHGHQSVNAACVEEAGGALRIEQKDLDRIDLVKTALSLLNDPARLEKMARAARRFARPDAARDLVREVSKLVRAA